MFSVTAEGWLTTELLKRLQEFTLILFKEKNLSYVNSGEETAYAQHESPEAQFCHIATLGGSLPHRKESFK